jgi:ferric-dicitrate binding protein FerR (iron transport regulator)
MRAQSDQDFLQAYLDGTLAPEQQAALEIRLSSDPQLADALLRLAREEATLTEWAHSERVLQAADTPATPVYLPGRQSPRFRRLTVALYVAMCAAAILLALVGYGIFEKRPQLPATEFARLDEVQGEVFVVSDGSEPVAAQPGQRLATGQGVRTQGEGSFAVVSFADTSRLELGSDTTVRMPPENAGKRVYLEQGVVAAEVPPQPADQPMVVATPHAEARFLETKSSFASNAAGTRIESEKGQMQLVRKSDGRTIDVPNGWYAEAAPAGRFDAKPMSSQVTQPRGLIAEVSGQAFSAALAPDGTTLAIGCLDGSIKLWDVATGTIRMTLPGSKRPARILAFAPVGSLLASAYDDRTLKFWDPVTGTELATIKDFRYTIFHLAFAPNASLLAVGGHNSKGGAELRLLDVTTRQDLSLPKDQVGGIGPVAFSPDGQTLATASKDVVKLWDVSLRQVREVLPLGGGRINALTFSADGVLLAAGGKDRVVKVWNVVGNAELRTLPVQGCEARALKFAPDGRLAVSADQNVTLWDLSARRERQIFRGHKNGIGTALFAAQGKLLITVGYDRTVRLWDVGSGS